MACRHLIVQRIWLSEKFPQKTLTRKKSETGAFNSVKSKIPYLEKVGINAIWLTGHYLANSNHFYNIWTQYAVINPDKIDPSIGTENDFKAMIDEAHNKELDFRYRKMRKTVDNR